MSDEMFPRNMYKSPGELKTNHGKTYDTVLVSSEDDVKDALAKGYVDSFKDALEGKAPEPVEEEVIESPEGAELSFDEDDF